MFALYETYTNAENWTPEKRAKQLFKQLEGIAWNFWDSQPDGVKQDYHCIKAAILTQFRTPEVSRYHDDKLANLRQRVDQPVA